MFCEPSVSSMFLPPLSWSSQSPIIYNAAASTGWLVSRSVGLVFVHVCVYTHSCMCVSACGGQGSMLDIFLNHASPYILRQGFPLHQELMDLSRMGDQEVPGTHRSLPTPCPQTLGLQAGAIVSGFYVGAGVKLKPSCLCTMSTAPSHIFRPTFSYSYHISGSSFRLSLSFFLSFLLFFWFFKIRFLCVLLTILELAL